MVVPRLRWLVDASGQSHDKMWRANTARSTARSWVDMCEKSQAPTPRRVQQRAAGCKGVRARDQNAHMGSKPAHTMCACECTHGQQTPPGQTHVNQEATTNVVL